MRMKSRRTLAILLSMVLLLALAPSGFAVELGNNNVVSVTLATPESDYAKDLKGTRVQADLYLLAPAKPYEAPYDNVDSYTYEVPGESSAFHDLLDKLTKELNGAEKTEEPPSQEAVFQQFEPYAQEFAGIVLGSNNTTVPVTGDIVVDQPVITVSDLQAGLYLLVIHGYGLEKSENPENGYIKRTEQPSDETGTEAKSVLTTRVVTDKNEYLFQPQLLTVPTKVDKTSGEQQYNTAYGDWQNILTIYAKPTRVPKNGDLKIIKNLSNPGSDPVTFVFEVTWTELDNTPMRKVVSITFEDGQTYKEYVLADTVPVGTEVTVTEVHSGVGYTAVTGPQTVTILATPPASGDAASSANTGIAEVRFDNSHDKPGGGHGILNHFTAGETGDFKWNQFSDSPAAVKPTAANEG